MNAPSTRAGLPLIKLSEGCKLAAYPDPATGGVPWTIGWGRTTNVKRGDTCTQAQADAWLVEEYDHFESQVRALVKVPLNANQLGALVCWTYNLGQGNLAKSSLLQLVNAGKFPLAAQQFGVWNKANKKVMAGLTKRRAAEAALFMKPVQIATFKPA